MHPKEARNDLGTGRLVETSLESAVCRVGLSWRSLSAALKEPVDASRWGVLFLGSLKMSGSLPEDQALVVLSRQGKEIQNPQLDGIILLDGNWKQAKTMWWRNPWMLKLNRIALNPKHTSRFGILRKQPRKQCLSTLESVAECLEALEGNTETYEALQRTLTKHLDKISGRSPDETLH